MRGMEEGKLAEMGTWSWALLMPKTASAKAENFDMTVIANAANRGAVFERKKE